MALGFTYTEATALPLPDLLRWIGEVREARMAESQRMGP